MQLSCDKIHKCLLYYPIIDLQFAFSYMDPLQNIKSSRHIAMAVENFLKNVNGTDNHHAKFRIFNLVVFPTYRFNFCPI